MIRRLWTWVRHAAGIGSMVPPEVLAGCDTGAGGNADIRVLVVEDEVRLREVLVRVLSAEGFSVAQAANAGAAEQALALGVDALITDVVLEGAVDGFALARIARMRQPDLPIIFISGFMSTRQAEVLGGDERAGFLRKPFDIGELLAVLNGLLAMRDSA